MSQPDLTPGYQQWSVDEIPYGSANRARVNGHLHLFYLLAAASLVEITSDLYTQNLVQYFHRDEDVRRWLEERWQREELQHGIALRRYVNTVWPEFDWDRAYRRFYAEYSRTCGLEHLEPTPALEMASRCVVETGTATMYTMIHRMSCEPVLRLLTGLIRNDEVRHYKHFYGYFLRYKEEEQTPIASVLGSLWARTREIDNHDAYCSFKHVFLEHRKRFRESDYEVFRRQYRALARSHYPYGMAVKMFLKPLGLHGWSRRATVACLTVGAKYLCRGAFK